MIRFVEFIVWVMIRLPLIAVLPVTQIWFMILMRWLKIWPEPGIMWYDWIGSLLVPAFVVIRTLP